MLAEGRNSRASSGLPKKRGTGEKKKEKQRLAGSGGGSERVKLGERKRGAQGIFQRKHLEGDLEDLKGN